MLNLRLVSTIADQDNPYLLGIGSLTALGLSGSARIYSGSGALGGITAFDVAEGRPARPGGEWQVPSLSNYPIADLALLHGAADTPLFASRSDGTELFVFDGAGRTGDLGPGRALTLSQPFAGEASRIEAFSVGEADFLALGGRGDGLAVYEWDGGTGLTQRSVLRDHSKVSARDIADLTRVEVGGNDYLLAASGTEGGLSSFRVDDAGGLHLVDTLGMKDGLWLSGLDSLASVGAGGVSYVALAATNSSSLSLVRVNPMGVLFLSDHVIDGLSTRFSRADAVTSFEVGARGFVVAGGADDGLSLLEILPDGRLFAQDWVANEPGGSLINISALAAVKTGSEVQIVAAGVGETGGLSHFAIDTDDLADPLLGDARAQSLGGSAGSDLIWGGAGAENIAGGGGRDILAGGKGADKLWGQAGADVFVFSPEQNADQVMDFELGLDRLDVGRWGRLYQPGALDIDTRSDGARVGFGENSLILHSADGQPLRADDLADSFLF